MTRRHICDLLPEPMFEPNRSAPSREGIEFAEWFVTESDPRIVAGVQSGRTTKAEIAAAADHIWRLRCEGWAVERLQRTQNQIAKEWREAGHNYAASLLRIGKAVKGPGGKSLRGPIVRTADLVTVTCWDIVMRPVVGNQQFRSWVNNPVTNRAGLRQRVVEKFLSIFDSEALHPGNASSRRSPPGRRIYDQAFSDFEQRRFFRPR